MVRGSHNPRTTPGVNAIAKGKSGGNLAMRSMHEPNQEGVHLACTTLWNVQLPACEMRVCQNVISDPMSFALFLSTIS